MDEGGRRPSGVLPSIFKRSISGRGNGVQCTHRRPADGKLRKTVSDERAQGLVEFALVASVLFFIFLGTVDFARFLYYQTSLQASARVGAEAASNHCPYYSSNCDLTTTPTSDSFVMWKTSCEANPYTALKPQYSSCSTANTSTSWTPSCAGSCTPCTQDICVSPSSRSEGSSVSVTVGYSFKPITILMSPFFPDKSCFSGDSTSTNHHTLCASSTGRVS